jgi:hypothetical protein
MEAMVGDGPDLPEQVLEGADHRPARGRLAQGEQRARMHRADVVRDLLPLVEDGQGLTGLHLDEVDAGVGGIGNSRNGHAISVYVSIGYIIEQVLCCKAKRKGGTSGPALASRLPLGLRTSRSGP